MWNLAAPKELEAESCQKSPRPLVAVVEARFGTQEIAGELSTASLVPHELQTATEQSKFIFQKHMF